MKKRFFTLLCALSILFATIHAQENMINGHEYVDLGLPSGTLWATCNVGANSPEEYGDYFAWGETEPKEEYNWGNYKWCEVSYDGTFHDWYYNNNLIKYCDKSTYGVIDNKMELEPGDDAAYVRWGDKWRMPNLGQLDEILKVAIWKWETLNGVSGCSVRGSNGNSLFLPASGIFDDELEAVGHGANYWSSTLSRQTPNAAYQIDLNPCSSRGYDYRAYGCSIRPVANGVSDGIVLFNQDTRTNCNWYSLDGKKLVGEPKEKGIYIRNGRKVVK